jgi:uncharacterized protein (TIGR02594 family)
MAYKTTTATSLFRNPVRKEEEFVTGLAAGLVVADAGDRTNDGLFVKVQAPGVAEPGWILSSDAQQVPDPEPPPVNVAGFVRTCLIAERTLNGMSSTDPWFVAADFIIARAIIETGLVNTGQKVAGTNGVGPLQVTPTEWARFLAEGGQFSADFTDADRQHPTLQVRGAVFRMHLDAKEYSQVRKQTNAAGDSAAILPSYLDVFHAYLANPEVAVAIRDAQEDAGLNIKSIGDLLQGKLDNNLAKKLSDDQITMLFARDAFKQENCDKTKSVSDFVTCTAKILNGSLSKAFDLIKQHAPDELPPATGGKPAWFAFAETQLDTKEGDPASEPRILAYFNATDITPKPTSTKVAWCGAFAAACMANAGKQASIPKGAAAAISWRGWGTVAIPLQSPTYPLGAVVVLSHTPGTDSTGHVGFFDSRLADGRIQLLGGNQHDSVNRTPFPADRVAAVRWDESIVPHAVAAGQFKLPADIPADRHQFADMIIDRFTRAGFSNQAQLAAALANAIAESNLNPTAPAGGGEQSFGLFQCNRTNGLGKGFTIEELETPETNIGIIIAACKKVAAFAQATTIAQAVDIFVRNIERPANQDFEVQKRTNIANRLLL